MHRPSVVRIAATLSIVATLGACSPAGFGHRSLISVDFISRQPPERRVEVIPERPNSNVVWVGGHWAANGNDYAWKEGSWQRPESGKTEWVEGSWAHEDRGWHYTEGHWQ